MFQEEFHKTIISKLDQIGPWFEKRRAGLFLPFYASFDMRDSGFKISNVDANIFPAGFNNICQVDKDNAVDLARSYINDRYGSLELSNIGILTEEHTNNPFYWENVRAIQEIIKEAGFEVRLMMPKQLDTNPIKVETVSGYALTVYQADFESDSVKAGDFKADLVISNNDFSIAYEDNFSGKDYRMNPSRQLGWYQRKKSNYFDQYNKLATEFSEFLGIDPWLITIGSRRFPDFDIKSEESRKALSDVVDSMIAELKEEYSKRGIDQDPVVFIKNNSGTYGLGILQVKSGQEVLDWNNKSRKKMKAAKGGRDIEELIIQEGIPTAIQSDDSTAEPAIYMIGCSLAGGFLRAHSKKGPNESLNSPGAVYKRLCVSDLEIDDEGKPLENVYGWIAKLGILAIGRETQEMKITYKDYKLYEG